MSELPKGIRFWWLREPEMCLSSFIWQSVRWKGPIQVSNIPPELHNSFGIYSYKEGSRELSQFEKYYFPWSTRRRYSTSSLGRRRWQRQIIIKGQISCFPSIVEHTEGYRAQKVRIDWLQLPSLTHNKSRRKIRSSLEERYRCEVITRPWNSRSRFKKLMKKRRKRVQHGNRGSH